MHAHVRGRVLCVAGTKGKRYSMPNARIMIHQPLGGASGQAVDIEIQAKEIIKMRDRLNKIFADATGQPIDRIEKDTDRDYWMSPDEGIEYGLVGKVVTSVEELG